MKKHTTAKKKLPVKKNNPAPHKNTSKPLPCTPDEVKLCLSGNWKQAAKSHNRRTGIMYRRSVEAVADVYRKKLREVLDEIFNLKDAE